MTRTTPIKFDGRYVTPILERDKTATIRFGWDTSLRERDTLVMQTPDDDVFAKAEVVSVIDMTITDAAAADIPGHESYSSVDECLDKLSYFYPDADLTPNSTVTVIWWRYACTPAEYRQYRKYGITP